MRKALQLKTETQDNFWSPESRASPLLSVYLSIWTDVRSTCPRAFLTEPRRPPVLAAAGAACPYPVTESFTTCRAPKHEHKAKRCGCSLPTPRHTDSAITEENLAAKTSRLKRLIQVENVHI